jgi:hypothetical protein
MADSARKALYLWQQVTPLATSGQVVDVGFTQHGLNIATPAEMVWNLVTDKPSLVAIAAKPIAGTAEAGEEIGRRAEGLLRRPVATAVSVNGHCVLEEGGRLVLLRSGWTDSVAVGAPKDPGRDVAIGVSGLVYVLAGREVRVYPEPPTAKPLWTIALPPKLLPAVAIAVASRGEVFVAGRGTDALAVFALDADGKYARVRGKTAAEAQIGEVGGLAITPALLIVLPGREGWVGQDRFLVLSDSKRPGFVALEAATLETLGRFDLAAEVQGATPGRLDVGNRAQIAFVDPQSGRSWALPSRVFAGLVEKAKFGWRTIEVDSTQAGGPR